MAILNAAVLVRLLIVPHFNMDALNYENATSPAFSQNFQNSGTPSTVYWESSRVVQHMDTENISRNPTSAPA